MAQSPAVKRISHWFGEQCNVTPCLFFNSSTGKQSAASDDHALVIWIICAHAPPMFVTLFDRFAHGSREDVRGGDSSDRADRECFHEIENPAESR